MICFRGEQSWRLPSNKVKQFYFTAEDPGSPVIHVYDAAGNVIETQEHKAANSRDFWSIRGRLKQKLIERFENN
jgi:hypothetical protein